MVTHHHVGRFTLERLTAGELDAATAAPLLAHLETCAECQQQKVHLEQDREAFKREVPYAAFRIAHEQRRDAKRPAFLGWRWLVPAFSGMAALALVLMVTLPTTPEAPQTRIKGAGQALTFSVLDQGSLRPGLSGEALAAGSTIQLAYEAGQASYLALFRVAGDGTVELLYPDDDQTMARLPDGAAGLLPFSLTLDKSDTERYIAFFAERAWPLATLKERLTKPEAETTLALPDGVTQAGFMIRKAVGGR